jgi:hypothetical protein
MQAPKMQHKFTPGSYLNSKVKKQQLGKKNSDTSTFSTLSISYLLTDVLSLGAFISENVFLIITS